MEPMSVSAAPSNLQQVESLILSLYEPNPPAVITQNQAILSRLQSTPEAWQLARQFLDQPDEKIQFFGALTIIIKLNTEASHLTEADATELLVSLINRFMLAISRKQSALVTRKLASALSTFFIQFPKLWPSFVAHLLVCFASQQARPPLDHEEAANNHLHALASLNSSQTQGVLLVTTHIIEDVTKLDFDTAASSDTYDIIVKNSIAAAELVQSSLRSPESSLENRVDAIKCLQSWIAFAQKAATKDFHIKNELDPLLSHVIRLLTQDELYESASDLLIDVLSNHARFLSSEHYNLLEEIICSPWGDRRLERLVAGDDDFDEDQFGQLLLSLGSSRVDKLAQADDWAPQHLLQSLCKLLESTGYPVAEDRSFVPAVEFWCSFAEEIADAMYITEESKWLEPSMSHLFTAVSHSWKRIIYPPPEEFARWDSADRAGFQDSRRDVIDLLQSTYGVAGPRIVTIFADLVLETLGSAEWRQLEAAVYCLSGLSECVLDDDRCDEVMQKVFSSQLLPMLHTNPSILPVRARQTCVSLIEQYTEYFRRHGSLLPPALNVLFSGLADPSVANAASKSILRLCASCRDHLHTEVESFLAEYQNLVFKKSLDCLSSERVIGAVAAVAQACPDLARQRAATVQILGFIQEDVRTSVGLKQGDQSVQIPCHYTPACFQGSLDDNQALHASLRALRCLLAVAKAFQTPSDIVDFTTSDEDAARMRESFQADADHQKLQKQIIDILLAVQQMFSLDAEVTELICGVLRCGFSESEPNPFVLPPEDVAQYIVRHGVDTPSVGVLVTTASSFVSSLHSKNMLDRHNLLASVLLWAIGLIQSSQDHESDPQLSQNVIDFVSRLMLKKPEALLQLQPTDVVEYFFLFTLKILEGREPLPKGAAAEFWNKFVNLRPDDQAVQGAIENAMKTLGPLLSQCIVRNIGGQASRSELEKLTALLVKLILRYPEAKRWLDDGLNDASFPSSKVSANDKTMFLKRIVILRGGTPTYKVVREFWLSCRGSSFSFAS